MFRLWDAVGVAERGLDPSLSICQSCAASVLTAWNGEIFCDWMPKSSFFASCYPLAHPLMFTTLEAGSGAAGASIVCPAASLITSLRRARSYSSLNLSGSKWPAFLSRIWACQLDHVLGDAGRRYSFKELLLVSHFIIVAQRRTEQPFAPGLNCENVFAIGEYDAGQR